MQLFLITLMLIIGLTPHLAMNAQVRAILNNQRLGIAILWIIGASVVNFTN